MESWSEGTHQDSDDDRSSCNSKFYRHCHSRELKWNTAEDNTDDYADEYRKQVRCVELFLFISEDSFHIVHRASFAHDSEFVTELESKVARWQQIDACTVYAGDVDAI